VTRVAFQGELGAFSEEAVHRLFGEDATPVPCRDFAEVGRAVSSNQVDFGVLPIENSLAGSVIGSYDVLGTGGYRIVGEVVTPIHHCILGIPGSTLDGLRRIISHPVALAQCTRALRDLPHVEAVAVYDTAGAAREVAAQGDPAVAAIAGSRAADRYGLEILARDIEDRADNQTRFLAVIPATAGGRTPPRQGTGTPKTTLLLEVTNEPGALLRILAPFARRELNLSKLESRPAGEPWSYRFFLEFDADAADPAATAALDEIQAGTLQLHVLGSYPRWRDE
jgi:prephenate dehydratase